MSHNSELKTLKTWAGFSTFSFRGTVKEGTKIFYGSNQTFTITSGEYFNLLNHFSGRIVDCGTSRTNPQSGSLGEWLQKNVTKIAIASYVGAILVSEGYARKLKSKIGFL
jgi:hypothetical protein